MKKADMHNHPNLLKVPENGDLYIQRAIELGFDTICFTDHMPFTVTGDEVDRIPFGGIADYCLAVAELKEKYKDKIEVLTGMEIDYRDECLDEIKENIGAGKFDRIIASSHLNIKGFNIPFEKLTKNEYAEIVLKNYLSAVKSGLCETVTHLDIFRLQMAHGEDFPMKGEYEPKTVIPLLCELFSEMEKRDVALEINAAPLYKGFDSYGVYPAEYIRDVASGYKLRRVYGSDAHTVDKIGYGWLEASKLL